MKKSKSTSEFDNPLNVPTLSKKPGVGVREYPSKNKVQAAGQPSVPDTKGKKKFGRAKSRKQKAAILLDKARKGK